VASAPNSGRTALIFFANCRSS